MQDFYSSATCTTGLPIELRGNEVRALSFAKTLRQSCKPASALHPPASKIRTGTEARHKTDTASSGRILVCKVFSCFLPLRSLPGRCTPARPHRPQTFSPHDFPVQLPRLSGPTKLPCFPYRIFTSAHPRFRFLTVCADAIPPQPSSARLYLALTLASE